MGGDSYKLISFKRNLRGWTVRHHFLVPDAVNKGDQTMNQISGVMAAVVSDTRDPMGRGRIRVRFSPFGDVKEEWARVATAPGVPRSGQSRLAAEDQVLLAFEHGDVRNPYVVGVLWDNVPPPPPVTAVRTVHLPTGSSLRPIAVAENGSLPCSATADLLQQTAPWLGSMECQLRILVLLKPLIEVIEELPTPTPKSLAEFTKAATGLGPCLLVASPAASLPFVRDLLCLSLQSLRCLLEQSMTQTIPVDAVAAIQGVLDLAQPFFNAAGVPLPQLSTGSDTTALQEDIDTLQPIVDGLGGCGE